MKTMIIGIFLWLFGTICLTFSNPRSKDFNLTRKILFWAGIILDVMGIIFLMSLVIEAF